MMQGMMPQQPMGMTRPAPCGSGGCGSAPVYTAGGAVTLPASTMTLPASAVPVAPGMPAQAEDSQDSVVDEN